MNSSYNPKPPRERYQWKPKAKPESLKFELIMGGAVRVYPDGREVCQASLSGRGEYNRRLRILITRQHGLCCLCNRPMGFYNATFEHRCPRGMAGARRDDRIEDSEGKEMNGAAHWQCNGEKGSKRI